MIGITGCGGYIGSLLTHELLKTNKVIGVDNCFYGNHNVINGMITNPNFTFHKMDVRDVRLYDTLKDCSVVIWLAALVGPVCEKLGSLAWDVNYKSIQSFSSKFQNKIIYCCTNSGYGLGGEQLCTEESPLKPLSIYGESKVAGESVVLKNPINVSLRLATVCGASYRQRMDLLVNDWTSKLYFDRKLELYEGQFRRNLVHIKDVVRAISQVFNPDYAGVYNVGLPEGNLSKLELANVVATRLNLLPEAITQGAGSDPDKRDYLVSNVKILKTGFRFKHTLEEAIDEIVNVCKIYGPDVKRLRNL